MNPRLGRARKTRTVVRRRQAVGPWSDLALHTIGWRAFQDLCSQVCEVFLERPVEIFREARDGGQDAVFLISDPKGARPAVGSVQCKHTSDATRKLGVADLGPEIDHVRELVAGGQADTYVFITNMSIDAPVAAAMRRKLIGLGVRKPHILGRQYIVRAIRSSPRLRALVPQVYGLGDLTAIIDERLSEQSRVLLESWAPKLKTYVPTRAHRDAVRAINEHKVVLLLGNPSSGKSAIGAIISTIASENPNRTVLALTSPRDFEAGWNPNDPGRFFWIDDAFGPNVMREDYVQDWTSIFVKVRAAIGHGNRFLLTSRKHIYEAARRRLGQRNLAQFADGRAVVDVGELTVEEKSQILYNHINYGGQSQSWRTSVKAHLGSVAEVAEFLPGIAERLGDPNFTKGLAPREASLVRFMKEPREHLIDTISALDEQLKAALTLVYVHQQGFDPADQHSAAANSVVELTGLSRAKILDCFPDLEGSFLKRSGRRWTFSHPTIADALTEILRQKPHMMGALIHGAPIDTILGSFTCEGSPRIQDALTIPATSDDALVGRLAATPDEHHRNWMLFHFLADRASDGVFGRLVETDPEVLRRLTWLALLVKDNPKLAAHARAHSLGLLSDDLREWAASTIEKSALEELDLSFLGNGQLLALIPPERLVKLGVALRCTALPAIKDHVDRIVADADLDDEPESHFENFGDAIDRIGEMQLDEEGLELVDAARDQVEGAIKILEERKQQREAESEAEDGPDWTHMVTQQDEDVPPKKKSVSTRSIYDDVDS